VSAIRRSLLVAAVLAGSLAVFSGSAFAAPSPVVAGVAPLLHGTTHCISGTPGTSSGLVEVETNALKNDTTVTVVLLNGIPDSTYYVAIACVEYIGSVKTNSQGNGVANVSTSGSVWTTPGLSSGSFFVDFGIGNGGPSTEDYRIAGPFT